MDHSSSTEQLGSNGITSKPVLAESPLKPIAIIGFSMRFPEDATSSDGFWKILMERKCVAEDWPSNRMNPDSFYHPDANRLDTVPLRGGFFLDGDLGTFDASFFSITSKDAAAMDPQQRGILETTYRALENSGISLEKISGSKTSVHTGSFSDDYKVLVHKDPEFIPKYAATGMGRTVLANRVSWFFNLTGPSIHMDSACSSSMMALDSACQGLQNGDAEMAIVAGANILFSPDNMLLLSNMNFLSPDSRCFSFDDRANGYARGEGYGVVILKPLSDAIRDNDNIRAVIRATGSNQDGRTPGITQPSRDAQLTLIRETYQKAHLDMSLTRFVEAHGTGTPIGDPIEASAIGTAFKDYRSSDEPLFIGAVKSNIGHLEGASGIAGLIKTILVLEKGIIPPNVFERLNPRIDAKSLNILFPATPVPWPGCGLRRASVSSFGFGGSNSHVVLDDAYNFLLSRGLEGNHCTAKIPQTLESSSAYVNHGSINGDTITEGIPKLLLWSAADESTLLRLVKLYESHFKDFQSRTTHEKSLLDNLAYTLNTRRSHLPWKSFAIISSLDDLGNAVSKSSKPIRSTGKNKLGYVFTGQGAQYARMGVELLSFGVFESSLLKSNAYLRQFGCQWSVFSELLADKECSKIDGPAYSQPLCTILQIALVDLFRSFGITPSAVVGHSSGEIAAAYCIGALSHKSACKVAYYRGKFAAQLSSAPETEGAMIAVGLSEAETVSYLNAFASGKESVDVSIGCINSPRSVTLTGKTDQIDALKEIFDKASVFARKLKVNVAYHSVYMNAIADNYACSLSDLCEGDFQESAQMVSSVTGKAISRAELCTSHYWVQNMVSPVRFLEALSQITQKKEGRRLGLAKKILTVDDLLEIGPHSSLQGPIKETLNLNSNGDTISYTSALTRLGGVFTTVLQTTGRLYCRGYSVNFANLNEPMGINEKRYKVLQNLPEYPFDHSQVYWHESRLSKSGHRLRPHKRLDLLGTTALDWNPLEARWRNCLRVTDIPWIQDHKVTGLAIYPAMGMIVMAIEGVRQLAPKDRLISGYSIKNATFNKPIPISLNPEGTETQLYIRTVHDSGAKDFSWSEFRLCVLEDGQWAETCRGSIQVEYEEVKNEIATHDPCVIEGLTHEMQILKQKSKSFGKQLSSVDAYKHLESWGLEYGSTFQRLQNLHFDQNRNATASIDLFKWIAVENANHYQPHVIHPTTFDSIGQLVLLALSNGAQDSAPTAVPTRLGKMWISNSGLSYPDANSINAFVAVGYSGFRQIAASSFATDEITGKVLISLENMEFTTLTSENLLAVGNKDAANLFYNMEWKPSSYQLDLLEPWTYCKKIESPKMDKTDFYSDIDFVLLGFLRRAIRVTDDKHNDLKPHLRNYIDWMKCQVQRVTEGDFPHIFQDLESLIVDETYFEAACKRIEVSKEGKFFLAVGKNLSRIVGGEIDALEFLSRDNLVQDYYEHINNELLCFDPIALYLRLLAHENPKLNILEIGAGTGSTSTKVLNALLTEESKFGYSQYDFTDSSSAFFEAAKDKFHTHSPRMKFKTLDIETDLLQQGFQEGVYDIVVASFVFHTTKNLSNTLRNVRSLLKPGGTLLLLEIAAEDLRTSFAFGLLPWWWLNTKDCPKTSPYTTTQQWDALFELNGFSQTKMEITDAEGHGRHAFNWLVTVAIETTPLSYAIDLPEAKMIPTITILLLKNDEKQMSVASLLQNKLKGLAEFNCKISSIYDWTPKDQEGLFISLLEFGSPLFSNLDACLFGVLQQFLTGVENLNILWVRGGEENTILENIPEYGATDGFMRTLRTEFVKLSVVTLWLQDHKKSIQSHIEMIVHIFSNRILKDNYHQELEFVEKEGLLHIGRLVGAPGLSQDLLERADPQQTKIKPFNSGPPLSLKIASPGVLDSFYYVKDDKVEKPLAPMEIEIEVKAVGANFVDLLTVLGRVNQDFIGGECSGIVSRVGPGSQFESGDRVVASNLGTFRTYSRAHEDCVVKLPDGWSFITGASVPTAFITAYHSLVEVAHIKPGNTVLIHAGAGGTGGAAIQVAKHFKAEIFTTVGSVSKRKLVMDLYAIPEDHIFYSRDVSFASDVMRMTKGRGVDIILNSLAGESLVSSWDCIASFGHFVEIGKRDIYGHKDLPMFNFARNVSFSAVDLIAMIRERPDLVHQSFKPVMELMRSGDLRPITPLHIYKLSELVNALQYLQSGKNNGKIVIDIQPEDSVLTVLDTLPTWNFDDKATYVIAGGLGGLGRITARWFTTRGATNLVLLSRSGPKTQEATELVQDLRSQGIRVEAPPCDITDAASLSAVLLYCKENMPPIKGCIQGSMVLRDTILENMTFEDWKTSTDPKIQGSWNLHAMLPQDMDFLILLSSVSGIFGNASQANYAAGNTYMDALAQYRVDRGQKAVSIDLGWMESAGVVSETELLQRAMRATGYITPVSNAQFFAILDKYCDPSLATGTGVQVVFGLPTVASITAKNAEIPQWMNRKTFNHMHSPDEKGGTGTKNATDYLALFKTLESSSEAEQAVTKGLINKLSSAFLMRAEDIDPTKPLYEYGIDSLLAVELRNWFSAELKADIAVFDIMGSANFQVLSALVVRRSLFKQSIWTK